MALFVKLKIAYNLNEEIKKLIDGGKILTWGYDIDGDYTYNVNLWKKEAWIRSVQSEPCDNNLELKYGIISRRNKVLTKRVYAVYHGRFSEMLLTHFDVYIENIIITSELYKNIDSF